ncbi:MAG TPA: hypothetical protein VIW47_06360 [Nitrospiraceae bacterium]|jgi:hypothetical protein
MFRRLAVVILLSSFYLAFQGCSLVEPPPEDLVIKGDHKALAKFYRLQARELRAKAQDWDSQAYMAERFYGQKDHVAMCRTKASLYRKAAEEADAMRTAELQYLP